jgi:hypothetical protein
MATAPNVDCSPAHLPLCPAGPKDNSNHIVLGTQTSKPKDLAGQMSLNPDHCWGIVRALVDMLMKQPEGESGQFVLVFT